MTEKSLNNLNTIYRSKYSVLDKKKLDDLYLTNLLRELWAIPVKDFKNYIKEQYPNPTVMEMVEIKDLWRIIKTLKKSSGLCEEDQKLIQYKHVRMYGKPRQIIELSGRDGEAIELSNLDDTRLTKEFKAKLKKVEEAIKKIKSNG